MPVISFPRANNLQQKQIDTQDKKNELLTIILRDSFINQHISEIKNLCINELKAISFIVSAQGNEEIARKLMSGLVELHKNYNQHINNLFSLFRNRDTGLFGKQNINRTAAKYVEVLREILDATDENKGNRRFEDEVQCNLRLLTNESHKWYRGNYIQHVHVTINHTTNSLDIQLGKHGGTMGNHHTFTIPIKMDKQQNQQTMVQTNYNLVNNRKPQVLDLSFLDGELNKIDSPNELIKFKLQIDALLESIELRANERIMLFEIKTKIALHQYATLDDFMTFLVDSDISVEDKLGYYRSRVELEINNQTNDRSKLLELYYQIRNLSIGPMAVNYYFITSFRNQLCEKLINYLAITVGIKVQKPRFEELSDVSQEIVEKFIHHKYRKNSDGDFFEIFKYQDYVNVSFVKQIWCSQS
jgi:hypothetical protein